MAGQELFGTFESFCAFGDRGASAQMDGAKFAKLTRDCKIIDRRVTPTEVDITFARVKGKGERKINFDQFLDALDQLAEVKYPSKSPEEATAALYEIILKARGPAAKGTATTTKGNIFDKLTDSSQYTGAHKHRFDSSGHGRGLAGRDSIGKGGGHGPVSGGAVSDLSQITRPGLRGGGAGAGGSHHSAASHHSTTTHRTHREPAAAHASPAHSTGGGSSSARSARSSGGGGDLSTIFHEYVTFGGAATAREMDNVKFSKLCRETGIIGKGLTPASVDICFSKVKAKGSRVIDFHQFQSALQALAVEKFRRLEPGAAYDKLVQMILDAGGPRTKGTRTHASGNIFDKLTDSSQYTGAHKHRFDSDGHGRGLAGRDGISKGGGAGRYRGGAVSDLSQITRPGLR